MLRNWTLALAIAVLSALTLSACSTYQPVDESFHKVLTEPYHLDAGDQLRITVFGQTDLTNTYNVDKAGLVAFPLIGSVAARGLTPQGLSASIAQKLRVGYIRDPDVSVEIERYRPFFIMGEVSSPGQYTYVPGMTVQNAIAVAGGFTPRGLQEDADITRQINGRVLNGRVPLSDPILPGDTIYVRERFF
jgi:polysaccharide export outer membrane protein